MSKCSSYNGTILPNLPSYDATKYPYALILESNDQAVLWLSSVPFRVSSRFSYAFYMGIDGDVAAYAANMTEYRWDQGEVELSGTGYATINGSYVWSNHNVCLYNIDPEIMPEWDSVTYPYLLMMTRSYVENLTQIVIYEAWHSTAPFAMNDAVSTEGQALTTEVIGPTFSHTTDTIGHHTMRLAGSSAVANWSTNADITSTDHSLGSACFNADNSAFNVNYWANHDIVGSVRGNELKANNWYELNCYAAAEPEEVVVEAPTDVAITGGNATYEQYATANDLICTATCPEGGTLSYKWYRNGSYVGSGNPYTPSTNQAGTFEYYVVVTNTMYGSTASVQSVSVTVTINAAETEDTEQETIAKRVKKHIIGYVLRLCGVPMAELIAEMLCKDKKVAASHYIYGTPSETGNIGLRSGESVTYYTGRVYSSLPDWWNEETHPYAFLCFGFPDGFDAWNVEVVVDADSIDDMVAGYGPAHEEGTVLSSDRLFDEWLEMNSLTYSAGNLGRRGPFWGNTDLYDTNGELYLAATDPIPVGEIVDTINDIPIYEDLR